MPAQGKKPGPGTLTQAQHRRAAERTVDQDRTLAASTNSKPPWGQPLRAGNRHGATKYAARWASLARQPGKGRRTRPSPTAYCLISPEPSRGCATECAGCGSTTGSSVVPSRRWKTSWAPRRARQWASPTPARAWPGCWPGCSTSGPANPDLIYEAYYDGFRSDITRDAVGGR